MLNFLFILYILFLLFVAARIIINTTTPSKGIAYLLLIFIFPIGGIIIYLSVGLNYRKRKLYKKKIDIDKKIFPQIEESRITYSENTLQKHKEELGTFSSIVKLIGRKSIISDNNKVQLLINGEQKFPEIIKDLKAAKHHIHIEYYIYENDKIGKEIADILIAKAKEGVEVRFIYDDFGAKGIRSNIVKELRDAGVKAFPFYKINFIQLANRVNYRNHRKIIVIDGTIGYIGGINISDKYINQSTTPLFWRDTHLKIVGSTVLDLQFTFLTDWNFCANKNITFSHDYFPVKKLNNQQGEHLVQVVGSGPDSDYPNILYSLIQTILLAQKELLITTPYFIPSSSFLNALKIASLSGVDVRLLIPGVSDSTIVNLTSQSFYEEIMEAGVRIFKYNKGFIHAKTMVCDGFVSSVGTANLDNRSFDLNFEINAVIYDRGIAEQLSNQFVVDLENSEEINLEEWKKRPIHIRFIEKVLHLFSAIM